MNETEGDAVEDEVVVLDVSSGTEDKGDNAAGVVLQEEVLAKGLETWE